MWPVCIIELMVSLKVKPSTDSCKPHDFSQCLSATGSVPSRRLSGAWYSFGGKLFSSWKKGKNRHKTALFLKGEAAVKPVCLVGLGELKENCKAVEYS